MAARKSGGHRAAERKNRARAELRGETYDAESIAAFAALNRDSSHPVDALAEMTEYLREAVHQAASDPAMPAEQRRDQIGRLAGQAIKALDPMRLIAELREEYRELAAAVAQLKGRANGPQELRATAQGTLPGADPARPMDSRKA